MRKVCIQPLIAPHRWLTWLFEIQVIGIACTSTSMERVEMPWSWACAVSARSRAYFSLAPFVGAMLAVAIWGEPISGSDSNGADSAFQPTGGVWPPLQTKNGPSGRAIDPFGQKGSTLAGPQFQGDIHVAAVSPTNKFLP